MIFILHGEVSLVKTHYGKIAKVTHTNTLGEEIILDRRAQKRRESAFAETEKVDTMEVKRNSYIRIKEMLFEMGLRKDFLALEALMRRSYFLKKNFTKR